MQYCHLNISDSQVTDYKGDSAACHIILSDNKSDTMVFNNANPIDVGEAVAKLKEDCPGLFLEPDETVHMAFKTTRDKYFFTSHRILVRDKHGITGKRTEYKSCPYHSIKVT